MSKEDGKPYFAGITPEMNDPKVYWKGETTELPREFRSWIMSDAAIERSRKGVEQFMNDPRNFKWLAERTGAWSEHIARYQKWLAEQKASGR